MTSSLLAAGHSLASIRELTMAQAHGAVTILLRTKRTMPPLEWDEIFREDEDEQSCDPLAPFL